MSLVDELGSLEPNDSFLLYFNHILSRKGGEMFAYLLRFGLPLRKNKSSSGNVRQDTKKIASLWKKHFLRGCRCYAIISTVCATSFLFDGRIESVQVCTQFP
ncbi:hypothetical protein OUZ56_019631 [Daphnia magna]|uniref:Uncharacterized protein n=1 Tax=Daphnia magna TaxID=35525 RepID=A0ABQ9ZC73_9CRUS|nr:hypothetical protein OUZ56_019631 [Daphnia magna]